MRANERCRDVADGILSSMYTTHTYRVRLGSGVGSDSERRRNQNLSVSFPPRAAPCRENCDFVSPATGLLPGCFLSGPMPLTTDSGCTLAPDYNAFASCWRYTLEIPRWEGQYHHLPGRPRRPVVGHRTPGKVLGRLFTSLGLGLVLWWRAARLGTSPFDGPTE